MLCCEDTAFELLVVDFQGKRLHRCQSQLGELITECFHTETTAKNDSSSYLKLAEVANES